jgi:aminoglycoside 6'-N-acetyltransferase I
MITVRPVRRGDADSWCRMRHDLWPDGSAEEHANEIAAFLDATASEPLAVLVAEEAGGELVGLAELSIRPCAEGCVTDRVAYLEGWYVAPDGRRRGVGRALVRAVEQWARGQGCTELASDTAVDNEASTAAHRAVGFEEVGLIRCFRRPL